MTCPHCSKRIARDSHVCHHCNRSLFDAPQPGDWVQIWLHAIDTPNEEPHPTAVPPQPAPDDQWIDGLTLTPEPTTPDQPTDDITRWLTTITDQPLALEHSPTDPVSDNPRKQTGTDQPASPRTLEWVLALNRPVQPIAPLGSAAPRLTPIDPAGLAVTAPSLPNANLDATAVHQQQAALLRNLLAAPRPSSSQPAQHTQRPRRGVAHLIAILGVLLMAAALLSFTLLPVLAASPLSGQLTATGLQQALPILTRWQTPLLLGTAGFVMLLLALWHGRRQ